MGYFRMHSLRTLTGLGIERAPARSSRCLPAVRNARGVTLRATDGYVKQHGINARHVLACCGESFAGLAQTLGIASFTLKRSSEFPPLRSSESTVHPDPWPLAVRARTAFLRLRHYQYALHNPCSIHQYWQTRLSFEGEC